MAALYIFDFVNNSTDKLLVEHAMRDIMHHPEIQLALEKSYATRGRPLRLTNDSNIPFSYNVSEHSININLTQLRLATYTSGDDLIGMTLNRALCHEIYHAQDSTNTSAKDYHYKINMGLVRILFHRSNNNENLLNDPLIRRMPGELNLTSLADLSSIAEQTPLPDPTKYRTNVEEPAVTFSDSIMQKYYGEKSQIHYTNYRQDLPRPSGCILYQMDSNSDEPLQRYLPDACLPPNVKNKGLQR